MANVYVRSGAGGAATGADWANAYITLAAALTAKAAGDDFWVSEDHAETQNTSMTLTSPGTITAPCRIICVNHAGTVPPVSADLATTATVTTTLATNITLIGHAYCYGITFNVASGANSQTLTFGSTTSFRWICSKCNFNIVGTGASGGIVIGGNTAAISYTNEWTDCVVKFANAGHVIALQNGNFRWTSGTTAAVNSGGTTPTTLIVQISGTARPGLVRLEGLDLSTLGSGKTIIGAMAVGQRVNVKDCKIDAAVTLYTAPTQAGADVSFTRVSGTGINYQAARATYEGVQAISTGVYRTGGATDGTTNVSWKIDTTANAKFYAPYRATAMTKWNPSTSTVTVTVQGVGDPRAFSALPKNDEFWIQAEFLGDASSGQGTFKTGAKADVLAAGAALTASTEVWDAGATARANTTAYVLGDVIKLATNPGRIFICTTAGTSAGSEPAGYASAVDGGAVTDNTAVFKAGWRFSQTVTLSSPVPAQIGSLYVYPKVAMASATVYLDPKLVLA